MLCTATHDTKRGEDARARLNVLSEMPRRWRDAAMRWARINSSARSRMGEEFAPDRSDEYLYYQALIGAWPAGEEKATEEFAHRILDYMHKAAKEKKVHTSWINPNPGYDEAITRFVEQTLLGTRSKPFLAQFLPFQKLVAARGMVNSLSQVILKATSPGVPDFYQGCESWDLNLVDPDNRRKVNYAALSAQLDLLEPLLCEEAAPEIMCRGLEDMLANWPDGRIKQYITVATLRFRRKFAENFLQGEYNPLQAEGPLADRIVSYERKRGDWSSITICPRLELAGNGLGDTALNLPAGHYRNILTKERLNGESGRIGLDVLFHRCPVALLQRE